MAKERRTAKMYTEKALERAGQMSKEVYHSIKHMNKVELVIYLDQLCETAYQQGYEAGKKAAGIQNDGIAEES